MNTLNENILNINNNLIDNLFCNSKEQRKNFSHCKKFNNINKINFDSSSFFILRE